MKTWKRLASGLFALVLLASLAGSALAAEPKTEKAAAKPAAQFTQWFPWLGSDPKAPEASEALLARMGTVINQTKTAGGETLTLGGAVWDGGAAYLSFTAKSAAFPKELTGKSWVYDDECAVKMPEKQFGDYLRKWLEGKTGDEDLSKEEMEQRYQNMLKQGQVMFQPTVALDGREGNTVTFHVLTLVEDVLEKPELTLHLENLTLVGTEAGTGKPQLDGKSAGTVLKGPFDFTFTLERTIPPVNCRGSVPVAYGEVPLLVKSVSASPLQMAVTCGIDVQGPVNLVDQRNEPVEGKTNIDLDKDLKLALNGLWTKDGKYVDCKESMGVTGVLSPADEEGLKVNWSRKFPYPIDPTQVSAVDIGGTRVELSRLERLDG